jgi:hypothetical protein
MEMLNAAIRELLVRLNKIGISHIGAFEEVGPSGFETDDWWSAEHTLTQ